MNQLVLQALPASPEEPDVETREFYLRSLLLLDQANIPYLVGGGYAMAFYTGIVRHTKDVAHLVLRQGDSINWRHLLRRFQSQAGERVLLSHLILFGFIYPSERDRVPAWVLDELHQAVRNERPTDEKICQGTLLSKYMYVTPTDNSGYPDVRLPPPAPITRH